jgi:hypothetical protein
MNGSDHRVTIISHLSETSQDARGELSELVTASGVLNPVARLGPAGQLVTGPVADAVAETLELDLGDPIVWAWQTHHALKEAARATLAGTGSPEHVSLATHKISSVHHPQVDVIVDEQPPLTITFDLTLLFRLEALLLTVQRGRLVGLSPAECYVEMTFGAHGMNVSRSRRYALPELVNVQIGLPLLPASAYVTAPEDSLQYPQV